MHIIETINEFREENKKPRVESWNKVVSDYCAEHCWAMVKKNELYHAEPYLLGGWSEAVTCCNFGPDWKETERHLIFDILGKSPEHRDILLNSTEMAYGIIMFQGKVYLTIRGR